jgi:hypothetical protein
LLIVKRHCKFDARQQLSDDQVHLLKQPEQIFGRMRGFGYAVQRGLHGLTAFALADVMGHGNAHLIILRPACRPENMHGLAILAQVAVLEVRVSDAGHDLLSRLQGFRPVFRVNHLDHAAADHLIGAVAENMLAGGADKYEIALLVDHTDGIEQQVDEVLGRRVGAGVHSFTGC